jgi:hypothetical protein
LLWMDFSESLPELEQLEIAKLCQERIDWSQLVVRILSRQLEAR